MVFIILSVAAVFISSIACDTPPFFYQNLTKKVDVNDGGSAELECYAGGSPTPQIRWIIRQNFGDPERFLPNGDKIYVGNILKFPSVNKNNIGSYICYADNGIGYPVQETFYLNIKLAPVITEIDRRERIGNEIELGCNVLANPVTTVIWYKNNEKLGDDSKYRITSSAWAINRAYSSLTFSSNDKDYYGTYKCAIANDAGKAEKYFKISEVPKITSLVLL